MHHHPLDILTPAEIHAARDVILACHPAKLVDFREIYLQEPPKANLKEFLTLEHSGKLTPSTPRPPRLAACQYDVVSPDRGTEFHEAVVDIGLKKRGYHALVAKDRHVSLML
jgi:primary-amine oxidase